MELRPDRFLRQLDAEPLRPVYLVCGNEPLLVQELADALRARARDEGYSEREVLDVDAQFDWNRLSQGLASLSLFATRRLFDLRILDLLQTDAARSTAQIAEAVGLSPSPCWRRIAQLEQQGVIRRRVALLDRERLDLGVTVVVQVRLTTHGRQSLVDFEERVRELPEVMQCFTVMGAIDFVLIVVTTDIRAYERLMRERLSQLPGVQAIESNIVMSAIKDTTALPLDYVETVD